MLVQIAKIIGVLALIIGCYCWVSADEWAIELEEEARTEQILAARRAMAQPEIAPEPEPAPLQALEPAEPVFHEYTPRAVVQKAKKTVKKSAVRAKKKLKHQN